MTRFDQIPDQPYGNCVNCGLVLGTEAEMNAHLRETSSPGGSHRARVTNPSRPHRIRGHLENLMDSAVQDFLVEVYRDLDREEFTEDEVTEALRGWSDFADAWDSRGDDA